MTYTPPPSELLFLLRRALNTLDPQKTPEWAIRLTDALEGEYQGILRISVKPSDAAVEDACEKAFFQFDARRKGYAEWRLCPMSERDAFKAEARALAKGYFPIDSVEAA